MTLIFKNSSCPSPPSGPVNDKCKESKHADVFTTASFSKISENKAPEVVTREASGQSLLDSKKSGTKLDIFPKQPLKEVIEKPVLVRDTEPKNSNARKLHLEELKRIDRKIERDRAERRAQIMSGITLPHESKHKVTQAPDLTEVLANYLKSLPPPDPLAPLIPPAVTRFPSLESFLPPDTKKNKRISVCYLTQDQWA
jgi:hypothetical protein